MLLVKDEIIGLNSSEQANPRSAPTGFEGEGKLSDAVRDLITTYHGLNTTVIDELHEEPSPLEFMRYVARNRPFVIRKGARDWQARERWDIKYLTDVLRDHDVNVAITPHGNADSVVSLPNGEVIFAKPFEREEPFCSVISKIQAQELDPNFKGLIRYAQTQNDNLRNEYSTLFSDVPTGIPFAQIALQQSPDAINFWLGSSKSVTAMHKDNYENIYVQILGQKHFVLLPPVEAACVTEKSILAGTYQPCLSPYSSSSDQEYGEIEKLVIKIDNPEEYVPFATWDPDLPEQNTTPFSKLSQPLRVTLNEGDMLYLPALWYHKVSQSCNEEGVCCAVNYWYDLEFSGGFWSKASFVRGVGLLSLQDAQEQRKDDEGQTKSE